jgi:hypothetical protein
VQNRFRSKSKAKEPEPQELDDFGTRWVGQVRYH